MGRGKVLLTLMIGTGLAVAGIAAPAGAASAVPAQHGTGQHAIRPGTGAGGAGKNDPFCKKLGIQYQASSGAQMFCFGPQLQQGKPAHPSATPRAARGRPEAPRRHRCASTVPRPSP